ncbi:hypothetical protein M8C21_016401 [Ambrosia artemisiifolia]|uniref:ADP,ATP carrier protein n=1 Tax=Ambrosia artemisiifolia TaxID=4212 RepID=A0AAD5GRF0_AMBAR|nr:hypothetical protein M8C21_016401 [Ambrosia artemisiifolia]
MIITRHRLQSLISTFVTIHPHETFNVFYATSTFFFALSAYFVVLPLRDEGAISLGVRNLPCLFVGSLVLTLIAAPLTTLIFSSPNVSKARSVCMQEVLIGQKQVVVLVNACGYNQVWDGMDWCVIARPQFLIERERAELLALVLIHRFFSASLVLFFVLWMLSSPANSKGFFSSSSTIKEEVKAEEHGWFYISVRIGFFLWVALLNLITISSTWARVIDAMDNESGSRLFGFIGAGATFGQLFGSLFATTMSWLGPYLLLIASLLMELAARASERINKDMSHSSVVSSPPKRAEINQKDEKSIHKESLLRTSSSSAATTKPRFWALLEGIRLIYSSTYLLYVSLFLWLSAMTTAFFYFQKVTIIASTVKSPTERRQSFAQINSFVAVFILAGQLTLTGRILTVAGVTIALCSAPLFAFLNLIAIAIWPTYMAVAVWETLRKVVTYVLTRPGRELLFTVVSQDEKYKAKVCIDVLVQRLGDAIAAGMYRFLYSSLNGKTTTISLYALPVCFFWILTGFHLGRRQTQLAKAQNLSFS